MNILWNTGCHKSMFDHMKEREEALFSPIERLLMDHLRRSDEGFIALNETGLYECEPQKLFEAINRLTDLHIIRRRDCDGVAYEWDDRTVLLKMLH